MGLGVAERARVGRQEGMRGKVTCGLSSLHTGRSSPHTVWVERMLVCRHLTSVEELSMSSSFSPLPSRTPRFRFRERGPKHVPKVSPTPLRPA